MPGNVSLSPFKNQRDPQHIEEVLYLNMFVDGHSGVTDIERTTYKVAMRTSLGFFELPNFENSQAGGPLLKEDPASFEDNYQFDGDYYQDWES